MAPADMAEPAMTTVSRVEDAGRMSSIEWEPKTLTLAQIKFAREAALYVVSTKTEQEAIRIFTEGLKPVRIMAVSKSTSSIDSSSSDDDVELGACCCSSTKGCRGGGSKGGRRRRSMDDRDVATTPF
ncbi:uncharacterized protein LOC100194130 [Zea mays]|uniref:Uncharacterized protein n=2 Tax=Zea mays TaxID=4577 RepID=B4FHJ4_MAIZE|nr:uncharacterized protein LOC100194130 [Zea mays]ACF81587.1 unknown [Zea mays]AQK39814.1 hypothetical protein ZEAMMB73_Zm00001d023700 [Zea mays]|eukprot:NP_001132655.1 uncharacterized protein LOC100194130 [Zea mays]